MRRLAAFAVLLMPGWLCGEVIDRIAVALDHQAITTSAIDEEVRVTAFLNQAPVDLSPEERRAAANRLIEQVLVRREMAISRYPEPAEEDVDAMVADVRQRHPFDSSELAKYGLTMDVLRKHLANQIAVLRFIDLRFRPGVAVSDEEVQTYYQETYVPDWKARRGADAAVPPLDETFVDIEEILTQQKINRALDEWLKQARQQAKIRVIEEAFQ